jgi:hypothetical protein
VYLAKKRAIKVPIALSLTDRAQAAKEALLDSGATECFIHPRIVQELKLERQKLLRPRKIKNVDGTPNKAGVIKETVTLGIQQGLKVARHLFLIADIGEDDLILGYPFLENF